MSNNPFLEQGSVHQRFPDISPGAPTPNQYSAQPGQWQQPQPTGFGGYGQQPQYGFQQSQQQPYSGGYVQPAQPIQFPTSPGGYNPGYQAPMMTGAPSAFRPTSSFGQQMAAQLDNGYGGGGGVIGQQTGYGGGWGQQPQQPNWNVISQFDPYAQLGALDSAPGSGAGLFGGVSTGGPTSSTHTRSYSSSAMPTPGAAPSGQLHPREHVRAHKMELEAWDPYAWKQFMNSFDSLRTAWEGRKRDALARAHTLSQSASYDYAAAQEYNRLLGVRPLLLATLNLSSRILGFLQMMKEAENNFGQYNSVYQPLRTQSLCLS
jgi:hypothetical protein